MLQTTIRITTNLQQVFVAEALYPLENPGLGWFRLLGCFRQFLLNSAEESLQPTRTQKATFVITENFARALPILIHA